MNLSGNPSPSRQTVITAAIVLKSLGHAGFDQMLLEFDIPAEAGRGSGLKARAVSLASYVLENRHIKTAEKTPLANAVVERAMQLVRSSSAGIPPSEQQAFQEAANRDGLFVNLPQPQEDHLVLGGEDQGDGWIGASISLSGQSLVKLRDAIAAPPAKLEMQLPRRIFIVHGHDEAVREATARFLEKINFEVVILHERPNRGRTIITKFREEAAKIGFAIVLMTPDDHGGKLGSETGPRARQNVVFELGFFIGALGPERVAALVKGEVERPSDFDGVVYINFDNLGAWKQKLIQELEAAGFEVDWKKAMGS